MTMTLTHTNAARYEHQAFTPLILDWTQSAEDTSLRLWLHFEDELVTR